MPVEAVRNVRLYQQIANQLAQLIERGEFDLGQKLPSEHQLARQFGVSRASVREAMIALETADLIEVRNGSGSYVREVRRSDIRLPWNRDDDAGPGPFEQFEAREILEVELAGRAAATITPEEIDELESIVELMVVTYARGIDDETSLRFHVLLAHSSRITVLAGLVEELWRLRQGGMWAVLRQRLLQQPDRDYAIAKRRQIIAALRARDASKSRGAMAQLLTRAKSIYFAGVDHIMPAESEG